MTNVAEHGTLTPRKAGPDLLYYMAPGAAWVYAHIDANGSVLYVGCTCQPKQRLQEHSRTARWFAQIAAVRYLGPFTPAEAYRIEEEQIRQLNPVHNIQHAAKKTA